MIKFFIPTWILILALCHSHQVSAQNQGKSESTHQPIFQVVANEKPFQFDQGILQAFTVKEDGSFTILAQTTADILNTTIFVLNITPTDSKKKIKSGEYKILPEDSDSKYLVRAEYAVNENGNSSFWWTDASQVTGGWIIIDDYIWPYGDGPRRVGDEFLAAERERIDTAFVTGSALFIRLTNEGGGDHAQHES